MRSTFNMLPLNKLHKYITTHEVKYKSSYENKENYINHIKTCRYLYDLIHDEIRVYYMVYEDKLYKMQIQTIYHQHQYRTLLEIYVKSFNKPFNKPFIKPFIKPFAKHIHYLDSDTTFTHLINTFTKYTNNIVSKLYKHNSTIMLNVVHLYIENIKI